MKKSALALSVLLVCGLNQVHAQDTLEISPADKEVIAQELRKEAASQKDEGTQKHLEKVAQEFENSQSKTEVELKANTDNDCVNCETPQKKQSFWTKLGRKLGKGASWVSTTTAKPFMQASGFLTGLFEKKDKNQDIVALYKFFLNHQEEFDELYMEAGTPKEMLELMLVKMEEISERKKVVIVKDLLASLGITKEGSSLSDLELSEAEIASIDLSKLDPSFVNNHPEYLELRPILGDVSKQDIEDMVVSSYFDKAISFENYKEASPKGYEAVATLVTKTIAPRIALNVVSKTLSGLYGLVTIPADIGTGVSAAICVQQETVKKFDSDKDLKSFCSYVTNRSLYQLTKSRAKGYVSGKKSRATIEKKLAERKARRAAKKEAKAEQKRLEEEQKILEVKPGAELEVEAEVKKDEGSEIPQPM